MVSFVSPSQPTFEPDEIRVMWHEHATQNTYVVWLGHDASLHLLPDDARELVAKLTACMVARGDAVAVALADDAEMRSAAAEAEMRQRAVHTAAEASA